MKTNESLISGKFGNFINKHGIQASIVLYMVFVIGFSVLCGPFMSLCKDIRNISEVALSNLSSAIAYFLVILLIVLPVLKKIGVLSQMKQQSTRNLGKGLAIGIGVMLPMLIANSYLLVKYQSFTTLGLMDFLAVVLCSIGAGFGEELLMRGGVFNILRNTFRGSKNDDVKAILLSSVLYDILHFTNLIGNLNIQNVANVLIEIMYSTTCGMVFAMLYLKYRNIWSVMIIHCLLIILYTLFEISGGVADKSAVLGLNRGVIAMFWSSIVMLIFTILSYLKRRKN